MPRTRVFSLLAVSLAVVFLAGCASSRFNLTQARYQAAHKHRRIIMNNDGNDTRGDKPGESRRIEDFLARRTTPLIGSQVDAIFYCTGVFNLYSHYSQEAEPHVLSPNDEINWGLELYEKYGRDPLQIMIDWGDAHGIEVFWSMRMNDTHDSSPRWSMLLCEWKKAHPELMMSTIDKRPPYGGRRWSAVDYGKAEVREKVFRIIQDVVTRYDVDGIEMDFIRHPVYFRSAAWGEPVPQAEMDKLTDLIFRVRAMINETARARRKPILLSARVPDSIAYCRGVGLDLERWLREGLLDMVAGSGYMHVEPWENWAALGKKYDVPVYACLSGSRLVDPSNPEGDENLKLWRGEALRAWDAGVDGIYTFNRFDPTSPIFRELGDPQLLRTLPHEYKRNSGNRGHLRTWVKGGEKLVIPDPE